MWFFIILGILQGIFEWLPISSEGFVALVSQWLMEANPIDVALFLHLGTLLAVLIYFRKDWKKILRLRNKRLVSFLVVTTIISLGIGFLLYNLISGIVVGTFLLLLVGAGLLLTSYFHRSKINIKLKHSSLAILSGVLQGLAVIPGLSRSGSTIFGLSFSKLSPSQILKLSYLMSAPAVLASSAYLILKDPIILSGWPALLSSFVVGILTLHLLMKFSQRINFYKFTLFFGLLCLVGAILGMLI